MCCHYPPLIFITISMMVYIWNILKTLCSIYDIYLHSNSRTKFFVLFTMFIKLTYIVSYNLKILFVNSMTILGWTVMVAMGANAAIRFESNYEL